MKPPPFIIAVDSREQRPFTFDAWPTAPATLAAGDYSIVGLEEHVAIERKSLDDLAGCCGRDRDRFKRELHRLQA
jgi:DNA excision repair protein ERCC-4